MTSWRPTIRRYDHWWRHSVLPRILLFAKQQCYFYHYVPSLDFGATGMESNLRSAVYKTAALPLSYGGIILRGRGGIGYDDGECGRAGGN